MNDETPEQLKALLWLAQHREAVCIEAKAGRVGAGTLHNNYLRVIGFVYHQKAYPADVLETQHEKELANVE